MVDELPLVGIVVAQGDALPPGLDALDGRARLAVARTLAEFDSVIEQADALAVYDFRTRLLHDADWRRARNLRWIHAASAGVDAVLPPAVVESAIVVTNSRGVFDQPIAEYVLGIMLLVVKHFRETLRLQAAHQWQHREARMLRGNRLLVVGTGSIGRTIAELARSAGMEVEGIAREAREEPPFGLVRAADALPERLPAADFVVIAAPLTRETENMFDAAAFAAMRPHAWLINIGRGPIVDEAALLDALRAGRLAGAALDVFEREPLPPGHPFWDMENVFVSPHMAGDTEGWVARLSHLFVDNFERWRRGEPLRNMVDKRQQSSLSPGRE